MIEIKGYKHVDYPTFKEVLSQSLTKSGKTKLQVASEIEVMSTNSVRNVFTDNKQTSSDKILTAVMRAIGLSGFVIWIFGKKYYYVKNGK